MLQKKQEELQQKKQEELQQKKEEEKRRVEEEKRRAEEEQRRQHRLREEQRLAEEQQMIKAEEERRKLEQKRRDELAAVTSMTTQYSTPAEAVAPLQTDGRHQFPSVNNITPGDHVITPGDHVITPGDHVITPGMSPVVDRSNKPAHLIQKEPHAQTQVYPQAQPYIHDIPAQPIVDRSTKPSSHHLAISEAYLSGIGQCYHGYYPFVQYSCHPILSVYPIG